MEPSTPEEHIFPRTDIACLDVPSAADTDDALRIVQYILTFPWRKLPSSPHFTAICPSRPLFLGPVLLADAGATSGQARRTLTWVDMVIYGLTCTMIQQLTQPGSDSTFAIENGPVQNSGCFPMKNVFFSQSVGLILKVGILPYQHETQGRAVCRSICHGPFPTNIAMEHPAWMTCASPSGGFRFFFPCMISLNSHYVWVFV